MTLLQQEFSDKLLQTSTSRLLCVHKWQHCYMMWLMCLTCHILGWNSNLSIDKTEEQEQEIVWIKTTTERVQDYGVHVLVTKTCFCINSFTDPYARIKRSKNIHENKTTWTDVPVVSSSQKALWTNQGTFVGFCKKCRVVGHYTRYLDNVFTTETCLTDSSTPRLSCLKHSFLDNIFRLTQVVHGFRNETNIIFGINC